MVWVALFFEKHVLVPGISEFKKHPVQGKVLPQNLGGKAPDGLATWKILWISCQVAELSTFKPCALFHMVREHICPTEISLSEFSALDVFVLVVFLVHQRSYLPHIPVTPLPSRWQALSPRCFVRMQSLEWIKITVSPPTAPSAVRYRLSWHLFSTLSPGLCWPRGSQETPSPKIWCMWYPWRVLSGGEKTLWVL